MTSHSRISFKISVRHIQASVTFIFLTRFCSNLQQIAYTCSLIKVGISMSLTLILLSPYDFLSAPKYHFIANAAPVLKRIR